MTEAHFSADGRVVAWLENDALLPSVKTAPADTRELLQRAADQQEKGAFRLHTRRLENGAKSIATPIVVPMPHIVRLSHDGSRVAMASEARIDVYEVASGKLLAAADGVSSWQIAAMFFTQPDSLRIVHIWQGGMRIQELDVARGRLRITAQTVTGLFGGVNVTADGSRIYSRFDAEVLHSRTGALLVAMPVKPTEPRFGAMLADGSTIVTHAAKLVHIDANGRVASEVPIPVPAAVVIAQIGASKMLLAGDPAMLIVDLVTKKVTAAPEESCDRPANDGPWCHGSTKTPRSSASSAAQSSRCGTFARTPNARSEHKRKRPGASPAFQHRVAIRVTSRRSSASRFPTSRSQQEP
ncbi:MAG TPA: hypothetical protein VGQ76_06315 [Thermoanaerobaculia bacterium]|jgi:hypothetical protein|nr:hypothetical protein [Thermoanaerobaculia bacterium]